MTDDRTEYLEALAAATEQTTRLGLFIDGCIAAGREAGLTWLSMGQAMGIEGNAVRQRMKRRQQTAVRQEAS